MLEYISSTRLSCRIYSNTATVVDISVRHIYCFEIFSLQEQSQLQLVKWIMKYNKRN